MNEYEFNKGGYIAPPTSRFEDKLSNRNKVTAALLALFLGTFGIHDFILDTIKKV